MKTLFAIALGILAQVTFSSKTVVVVVPVTVSDDAGRPITGLTKDRFRISDDGREQAITMFEYGESPVTLGLVVDGSASMRLKLTAVMQAIDGFASSARPDDELFLVHFNERVSRATFAAGPFTNKPEDLRSAFAEVRPSGTTALWDAITQALQHLRSGTFPKKALIIVSDGGDNASRRTSDQVLSQARAVGGLIYTIGLSAEPQDRRSNRDLGRLATESGGTPYLPRTLDDVVPALTAIAGDLRQQYVLGFTPSASAGADAIHKLRVTVDAPARRRVTVRSRSSYSVSEARER